MYYTQGEIKKFNRFTSFTLQQNRDAGYYAGFDFLIRILGIYIIPAVILMGIIGIILYKRGSAGIGVARISPPAGNN